jgi:hypothetical protein
MDWFEIFKVQIVTPTTKISQRKEPVEEEEKDCCQEAKDSYKKLHSSYRGEGTTKEYDIMYSTKHQKETGNYGGWANKSCKEFREYMERGDTSEDTEYGKILIQWNKCEGRD